MKVPLLFRSLIAVSVVVFAACTFSVCFAQTTPTTTILSITPSATVSVRTTVKLTASVTAANEIVHPGLVLFCNAEAKHYEDTAILGQAQLTTSGTAAVSLRLGIGTHSVKAVFRGGGTHFCE